MPILVLLLALYFEGERRFVLRIENELYESQYDNI